MKQIKFACNVGLAEVNPHNFALKNDYINNLMTVCLIVFPIINDMICNQVISKRLKVIKGFLSKSYIMDTYDTGNKQFLEELLKHSVGKAVEVTWEDFTVSEAIEIAKKILLVSSDAEESCKCLIKPNSLLVLYDVKDFNVIESITHQGERRTIFRQ